jgi:hypothetical protein
MVQNSIESFEDTLLCKVHLINEQPVALLDSLQEYTVAPSKLDVVFIRCDVAVTA